MTACAYYSEWDPYAAQWLRNLVAAGHIAPGDVDERSISDVRADDLRGYRQCHFFAGIGVWSHALRRAGWPDEEEVWTGSCPCQPFSDAGKGSAFDDERDLWPEWFSLIGERRPRSVFGEQVASRLGLAWIDAVHADLEGASYTVGAVDTCSAGFGSPNIRQRLYWMADAERGAAERHGHALAGAQGGIEGEGRQRLRPDAIDGGVLDRLGEPSRARLEGLTRHGDDGDEPGRHRTHEARPATEASEPRGVANTDSTGREPGKLAAAPARYGHPVVTDGCDGRPGPLNGFWRDADWLCCTDGKWRAVESGTFPLVTGAPSRLGRLRAYGNGLNAEAATWFVRVAMEARP